MKKMNLSTGIRVGIGLAMAMVCTGAATLQAKAVQDERPNIIFFIADDMTPEMFNAIPEGRGKNLTPNLDRLAAEGVFMTNQRVVSPVCTPSPF